MLDNSLLSMDNGVDKIVDADATDVAREYYTSYAKYVLEYRALPSVYDGLKPVQRRAIYIANQFPQKLMKTAKMSGAVLSLHPHGQASVDGALNEMAHPLNAFPLFNTKGNFGGVNTGPSATRYTELCLNEAARFNFCQFVDYADYEIGEIGDKEPSALPSLIPYSLFKGSEGIGIGLSTKVMPLNLIDLIDYYIDYIKNNGHSSKLIRPDVGYVMFNMEDQEVKDSVNQVKGKLSAYSVITQISDNSYVIEGLFNVSIDTVINKMDKWGNYFSSDKVGFRDASTDTMRYVFEIYDDSVDRDKFVDDLKWATHRSVTYSRVVEEDGCAIYSSLNYMIKKSLEYLNKVIDKKISTELSQSTSRLELYEVLHTCKDNGVFDNIAKLTSDELVNKIVSISGCSEELAREVIKKPISYLTRSHESEEEDLKKQIEGLQSHDRTKYLIGLYKELRKMIMPIYTSRKHSMLKSEALTDPRIRMDNSKIYIDDGKGDKFNSRVLFVSSQGYIYPRTVSSTSKSELVVDTRPNDPIVGFATDIYDYVEILTKFRGKSGYGRLIVNQNSIKYDKAVVTLDEDSGEYINKVNGLDTLSEEQGWCVRSRVSRTNYFEE